MYLLLIVMCIISAGATYLGKIFQKGTALDISHLIIYNLINASFACVFFLISLKFNLSLNMPTLIYAIIFASLIMVNLCANLFSMKYTPLPIITIVNMASGILLPSSFGILFFKEKLTFQLAISGILILVAASIPFIKKSDDKKRFTGKSLFWCSLSFILTGSCTILMQLYAKDTRVLDSGMFFFITNFVIVIACFIILFICSKGKFKLKTILTVYKPLQILNIGVRTLLNNISSVLQVFVLAAIPVSFYSVFTASLGLILTVLLSYFVFNEKQSKITFVSLILAIAATITNVL